MGMRNNTVLEREFHVQILRNYQHHYETTADALSQCWANKWFLGCSYPRGVHAIIDEWPAPRKEDVNDSIVLPYYEELKHLNIKTTTTTNQSIQPGEISDHHHRNNKNDEHREIVDLVAENENEHSS